MPDSDRFKVRGIGVAVNARTSTSARRFFSCSFCRTPKRCSSSMTTRPRFLNVNALPSKPVRADHDIHLTRREALGDGGHLAVRAQPRHDLDAHRPVREAVAEGLEVLLGEQGGGGEDRDLAAAGHRQVGGAHRDFGLAEADIAADQAVRGLGAGQDPRSRYRWRRPGRGSVDTGTAPRSDGSRRPACRTQNSSTPRGGRRCRATPPPRRAPARPPCAWPLPTDPSRADAEERAPRRRRRTSTRDAAP